MNKGSVLRASLALWMLTLTAGCASNGGFLRLQTEAAARRGVAEARFEPPALARVCTRPTPHATPQLGEELSTLLVREGAQLNQSNQDKADCRALEQGWRDRLSIKP